MKVAKLETVVIDLYLNAATELAEELSETSGTLAISGDGLSVEYAREFLDRAVAIYFATARLSAP